MYLFQLNDEELINMVVVEEGEVEHWEDLMSRERKKYIEKR
jgi:hypothetical protein